MNQPSPSATNAAAAFAKFAHDFTLETVPSALVARAKLSLLDAIGIGLAASQMEFGRIAAQAIGSIAGAGEFPVVGLPLRLPQRDAAHLNGTLIHGLDYDDTHTEAIVHTSASAAPTTLSGGLATNATGARALGAFIIASECASRIGAAARGGFHEKGFHPTAVVGAFGATLAAGYLHRLDVDALIHAQGIVLSKAAGSLQFLDDGAWTKRNHPGWASACGLTAVAMAAHGYTGPSDPYFGRFGLFPLHTQDNREINGEKLVDSLGSQWEMRHIAFKPYPACHLIHAFADAALAIKREHHLSVDEIERIVAHVHEGEIPVICEPAVTKVKPQNSYDAQFSVNYVTAAALVRERFSLNELEPDALEDPVILDLCRRTSYIPDPDSAYPNYYSGAVDIVTKDGRNLHHREQINRGSADNPMLDSEIESKFLDNATRVLTTTAAEHLMELILNLEQEPDLSRLAGAIGPT